MQDYGGGPPGGQVHQSRPVTSSPPGAARKASATDAAKALNEIYSDIKNAPKYLRVSHLIQDYNKARQHYDSQNFEFVVSESVRIKDLLHRMKEDYNNLALQVIKSQEELQDYQSNGFPLDYETLFRTLEECTQMLKKGELDAATSHYGGFSRNYEASKQQVLEPVRRDAQRIMQQISVEIEQAQWDNIDTTKAEDRYGEILEGLNTAKTFSEFQSLVEQTEDIKDLLEDARNEKAMVDELPKQLSVKIQQARIELINLRKMNMDIESQIDLFDAITSKFTNADDKDEFARIGEDIDKLFSQIEARKGSLDQILNERNEMSAELEKRKAKIAELTQRGYLMAAMTNKVEKAEAKMKAEASQDVLKQTKRFLSNFDAELTSIEAQDIEEFNLRIRLLSDFEQLSDLYDKLEDDIDDVMEFLVTFSQVFSEAQSVDDFKGLNGQMRTSLNLVKAQLGMPLEEEEEDIPQEEEAAREEFVSATDRTHLPPPPPD